MTVSFNGLGNEGRLGNQMFQYAFIRGMSKRYGYDFIIPDANANRFDNYGLFDCFEFAVFFEYTKFHKSSEYIYDHGIR